MLQNNLTFFHEQGRLSDLRNDCTNNHLTATTLLDFVRYASCSPKNPMPSLYIILDHIESSDLTTELSYGDTSQTLAQHLLGLTNNLRLNDFQIDIENKAGGLSYDNPWKNSQHNNLPIMINQTRDLTITCLPELPQPKQAYLTAA